MFIFSHSWENVGRIEEGEATFAFAVLLRTAAAGAAASSEGSGRRAGARARSRIRVLLVFLRIIKKVVNQHPTKLDLKMHKLLEFLHTQAALVSPGRSGGRRISLLDFRA